jgi:2-polyprenyl-6-methoxyphenol hydroxylase-like FAD-dependent oxidoreductase
LPPALFDLAMETSATPPPVIRVRGKDLSILNDTILSEEPVRSRSFNRPTLREIMLAGLTGHVSYGAELTGYEINPDGTVTVTLADGRTETGDVLVGADGVGSAVRTQLLPDAEVADAGLRLIYGKIPLTDEAVERMPQWVFDGIFTVVAAGPGHPHVGMGPVRFGRAPGESGPTATPPVPLTPVDDYLAVLVGGPAAHPGMPGDAELRTMTGAELREAALGLVADWHPDIHQLLQLWPAEHLLPLRISTAAPVEPWTDGPVTLLGDAVHAMSPVLASGANTAIRDAGELATALAHARDHGMPLLPALRQYESEMIDHAFSIVNASQRTGRARVGQK